MFVMLLEDDFGMVALETDLAVDIGFNVLGRPVLLSSSVLVPMDRMEVLTIVLHNGDCVGGEGEPGVIGSVELSELTPILSHCLHSLHR